jgi:hypothetical protein
LIDQLFLAIAEPPVKNFCFNPRHGIRAIHREDTVDLVICFECRNFIYSAGSVSSSGWLSDAPEPLYSRILKSRGVPLAQP